MKIHSRPTIVYYVVLFSALAPYFVHLSNSLQNGTSALDRTLFLSFLEENILLFSLSLISIFFAWKMSGVTKILMSLLSVVCLVSSMSIALIDFNKVILIMDFFFLVTTYYLMMVFSGEISSASYNPLYVKSTIGQRSEYDLPCSVKLATQEIHGVLTNWDEQGCFISLEVNDSLLPNLDPTLEVETRIDDIHFNQNGRIVSSFEGGIGIRFSINAKLSSEGYNWSEYFKIIDHRGFTPRSKSL